MRGTPSALVAVAIVACGPEPESLEARIDGVRWQAERTLCTYYQGELKVHGHWSTGPDSQRALELQHLPLTGPGTVLLAEEGPRGFVMDRDAVGWNTYVGFATTELVTGSATVTRLDLGGGRCEGTFSFTAVLIYNVYDRATRDTVHVTEGSWMAELYSLD